MLSHTSPPRVVRIGSARPERGRSQDPLGAAVGPAADYDGAATDKLAFWAGGSAS